MKQKYVYLFSFIGSIVINSVYFSEVQAMSNSEEEIPSGRNIRLQIIKNPSQFPWRVHGQVVSEFNGMTCLGSGVLINKDCVLTAAYNIYLRENFSGNKKPMLANQITFYPARSGDMIPWKVRAIKVAFHPEWRNLENDDEAKSFSVGVIKLEKPLGEELGYAGIVANFNQDENREKNIKLMGYPMPSTSHPYFNKIQYGNMYVSAGTIQKIEGARLFYDNDTLSGMGGAAIMLEDELNPQCIGVHLYGGMSLNSGVAFTKKDLSLIDSWIQEMSEYVTIPGVDEIAELEKIEKKIKKLEQKKKELMKKENLEAQQIKKRKGGVAASPPSKRQYNLRKRKEKI